MKIGCHNFLTSKVTFLHCLFYLNNSENLKIIIIIFDLQWLQ